MRVRGDIFWLALCLLLNVVTCVMLCLFIDLNEEHYAVSVYLIVGCVFGVHTAQLGAYLFKHESRLFLFMLRCVIGSCYELMHYFLLSDIPWAIYVF